MDTAGFFETLFENARGTAMIIMDEEGMIVRANNAFTSMFGYRNEDVVGKSFSIFFTPEDKAKQSPESELVRTKNQGVSLDTNYLVHQSGAYVWVTGESIKVQTTQGDTYIVKDIHEIHTQKLLEEFLMEANEFIDTLFSSVTHTCMVVMDTRMKLVRVNKTFCTLFDLSEQDVQGKRLGDISHPLWSDETFQQLIRQKIVKNEFENGCSFYFELPSSNKTYHFQGKFINGSMDADKKILLIIS